MELSTLVEQVETLSVTDKSRLFTLLKNYLSHMTTKPGKCKLFKYEFKLIADKPLVGYSRAIPFANRSAVREQIKQMIKDDILEISTSHILNPLTIVSKGGKKIRLCVDARKVSQFTVSDHERTPPFRNCCRNLMAPVISLH
jgi:hypothetical protein